MSSLPGLEALSVPGQLSTRSGGSRNLKRGVPTLRITIMQASISIPPTVLNLGKGGSMEPPLPPPRSATDTCNVTESV